ncbi:hypothetical protein [Borrelia sp. RT5S]|uniref:hypothetical protein n=1 Tax=Borrelia sp. RT5S TaxID=2898581 RepID=UPI001E4ADA04|nr:hypothetical protein [Borrelia sp. RT5S]UGQ16734.1 hypothetical protein LSO06_05285 [Borrelia sp. RT5S]
MYARVIGILILILFTSCKSGKAEDTLESEVEQDSPELVEQWAAEGVSKATGKSVAEVKSLDGVEKFAKAAKDSAEEAFRSSNDRNDERQVFVFIDEIREAAGKFDVAFKSLVSVGLRGGAAAVIGNMSSALGRLELAGKLTRLAERGGGNALEEASEAALESGGDVSCIKEIENNKEYTDAPANGIKACVKNLMEGVADLFEEGVRDKLGLALKDTPYKFKDPLGNLWDAAHAMSAASYKVMLKY